ncbi:MAG: hypothetical protein PUH29_11450 [Lachnospiraceae bacterium]|nr:hypothetical protein [Lachnospiraceae bacterium]
MKKRISIIMAAIFAISLLLMPVSSNAYAPTSDPIIINNNTIILGYRGSYGIYHCNLVMKKRIKKVTSSDESMQAFKDGKKGLVIDGYKNGKIKLTCTIQYTDHTTETFTIKPVKTEIPVKYVKLGSVKFIFKNNLGKYTYKKLNGTQKLKIKPKKNWIVTGVQQATEPKYLPKNLKSYKKIKTNKKKMGTLYIFMYNKKTGVNTILNIDYNCRKNDFMPY